MSQRRSKLCVSIIITLSIVLSFCLQNNVEAAWGGAVPSYYFTTTWKTDNPGTSNSTSITIPTYPGETYLYDVDWNNDGTFDQTGITGDVTHDFTTAGTYTLQIKGTFPRIYFNNGGDKEKIISIDHWSTFVVWESMANAFYGCTNLVSNASDAPNLSSTSDLSNMFSGVTSFDSDISSWDVQYITDMTGMFTGVTISTSNYDALLNTWSTRTLQTGVTFDSGSSKYCNSVSKRTDIINANDWVINDGGLDSSCTFYPPLLTTEAASSITETSATLNGTITNIGVDSPTVRGFQYGLDKKYTGGTTTESGTFSVGTFTADIDITSFVCNTTYHYRSYATNSDDIGYGNDQTFNTRACEPPLLTTEAASTILEEAATLNGTITDIGISNATVRGFEYGLDTSYGNTTTENGSFIAESYAYNLTSLDCGTTYHYRSYATNIDGIGYGNDQSFTTSVCVLSLNNFVTTWKTDNNGSSNDSSITIPTYPGLTYLYDIDWNNDGRFEQKGLTGDVTHDFTTAGTYTVRIRGTFPRIYFNNNYDKEKLLSVDQWGTTAWSSMNSAFYGCLNLVISATDIPNLSGVTSVTYMFANTSFTSIDTSSWNTSTITDMSEMFGFRNSIPDGEIIGWNMHKSPGSATWKAIASSSDGTKLVAAGNDSSYIYTSTDRGVTWTKRTSSGIRSWKAIASSSDGTKLVAVASSSYIYTSTDSGATWTEQTGSGSRSWLSVASSSNGTKLVAGVSPGYIYTSTDSGVTWTEITSMGSKYWTSIASSSDGTKLAAADSNGGYVYGSTNSGVTWTQRTDCGSRTAMSVAYSSNGTKLVATDARYICTSDDDGITWTRQSDSYLPSGSYYWTSVAISSNGVRMAAVTQGGKVYFSDNNGVTWTEQENIDIGTLVGGYYSVTSSSDGYSFLFGGGSNYLYTYGILNTASPYLSFVTVTGSRTVTVSGITNTDQNTIYGVQYGLTTSYGLEESISESIGLENFSLDLSSIAPNTVYHYRTFTTNSKGTGYSEDGTFKILPFMAKDSSGSHYWVSMASSSDGTKLAAASGSYREPSGYIYTSTDGGENWVQKTGAGARQWVSIASSSDGTKLVAAVGDRRNSVSGYIYTSIDSGTTWTEQTGPGSLRWHAVASSSDGTKLAAIAYSGYIYTSTDSGATWTAQTSAGSRSWYSITSSSDGTKLTAVVSSGYIYTSTDSGATWTERTSAGSRYWGSVAMSSDGTKIMAGVYSYYNQGLLYISNDSGATWNALSDLGSAYWSSLIMSSDGINIITSKYASSEYVYSSHDGGLSWTKQIGSPQSSSSWVTLAMNPSGSKIIAGRENNSIYISNPSILPTITTTSATSVSQLRATLNGNITDIGGEYNSERGFEYGLTTSYGMTTNEEGDFSAGVFSDTISSLSPNTTYHYRSYSINSVGTSYGEDIIFNTSAIESPSVETHGASLVTNNSATLNGEINDIGGSDITVRGFEYGTTTSYGISTIETGPFDETGSFSSDVNSLIVNTTYHFRAYATNSAGTSYGDDYTFVASPYIWRAQIGANAREWSSLTSSSNGTKMAATVMGGYIHTSTDSGAIWTEQINAGSRAWISIASSSDGTKLVAAVSGGYIYTSTNSGVTWIERTDASQFYGVASSSDGTKLTAIKQYGYIYTSTDSGATWTERRGAGIRSWYSVASSSDGTKLVAVATGSGYIYTSADSGATWVAQTNAGSRSWYGLASSSDGTKLVAVVHNGYIYTSTDSGAAWTERTSAGARDWKAVTSSANGTVIVATSSSSGGVYLSTDSGATWVEQTTIGLRDWGAATSSSGGIISVAVSGNGYIYTYGEKSLPIVITNPTIGNVSTITLNGFVDSASTTHGFEYGTSTSYGEIINLTGNDRPESFTFSSSDFSPDVVYHYRAYATNSLGTTYSDDATFELKPYWTQISGTDSHIWNSFASSTDGEKIVTTPSSGYIYTSIDGGETWAEQIGSGNRYWTYITSSSNGEKLAATVSNGYIYTSTDGGVTWSERTNSGSRNWTSITSSLDGEKLAATVNGGYIYTSTDGGITWTSQTNSGSRVWKSISGSSDGTKLIAIVNQGYAYVSTDSGITWTEQTNLGNRYWSSVTSSLDGTKLIASSFVEGLYKSDDSGASWEVMNGTAGHGFYRVSFASNGLKMVTCSDYVYTSVDGGSSWSKQTDLEITNCGNGAFYSPDGNKIFVGNTSIYTHQITTKVPVVTIFPSLTEGEDKITLSARSNTYNTARGFEYGLTTSYGYSVAVEENESLGLEIFQTLISSLLPNTVYHYRAYATNSIGTGYSQDGTFEITTPWYKNANSVIGETFVVSSDGQKIVTIKNGYIYTSTDSGIKWTRKIGAGNRNWYALANSSDGQFLAATVWDGEFFTTTGSGYIYTSTNSGATWTERASAGLRAWSSITVSDDGTKLAASTFNGYVYTSTDSGATWTEQTNSGSRNWTSITGSLDGTKLVATVSSPYYYFYNPGYIYISNDSGATWTEKNSIGAHLWQSVALSSDETKLIAASSGYDRIYTSIDGGDTWTRRDNAGLSSWNSVDVSPDGTKMVAADGSSSGAIYLSVDSGDTWTAQTSSMGSYARQPWKTVKFFNGGEGIIASSVKGGFVIYPAINVPSEGSLNGSSSIVTTPTTPTLTQQPQENTDSPVTSENGKTNEKNDSPSSNESNGGGRGVGYSGFALSPEQLILNNSLISNEINEQTQSSSSKTTRRSTSQVLGSTIATQTEKILENPVVNATAQSGSVLGVTTATLSLSTLLFVNPITFAEIIFIPSRLWILLLTFLGIRKKNRPWGTVYDSVTKQPLDPVYLVLEDLEGKEIATCITDLDGRYGFLVEPGTYRLKARKTNYEFPSKKLAGKSEDEIYNNLYFDGVIELKEGEVINKNIPMDPLKFDWNEFIKKDKKMLKFFSNRQVIVQKIADVLFVAGFIFSAAVLIVHENTFNTIVFIVYILLFILRGIVLKKKIFGNVKEKDSDKPLPFAVLKVYYANSDNEITRKVANQDGKYYCLVPNGEYYTKIENKNPDESYSLIHTSNPIEVNNGYIAKKFKV